VPVADPDDRELRIGCGAALFNLRLALHRLGIRPLVTIMPNRSRPGLLAVVRAGGRRPSTPDQQHLLQAVPQRHTNRHPYSDAQVTRQEQYALRRAAQDESCWLHLRDDRQQRSALQHIAARAHERQMSDPLFRAEFDRWTTRSTDTGGVPAMAGPLPEPQDRWVLRDYTGGAGDSRVEGKDFEANRCSPSCSHT
jgi:hypothetical protein